MKKFFVGFGVIIVVIAGVLLANTLMFPSQQLSVEPADANPVYRKRAINKLAGAVQIPTISREAGAAIDTIRFEDFLTYLGEQFPLAHENMTKERISGYSLLYRLKGSDSTAAPVMMTGHYDVVPAPDSMEWDHPPFSGRVINGYIWGRGTLDDKIDVIGIMEALETLLEEGFQPKRDIYLAFGHDEEIGGQNGARVIADTLEKRGLTPSYILDEGMMITQGVLEGVEAPLAMIGTGEKGYLSLEMTARSSSGHSSVPPKQTAIGKLSRAVASLEEQQMPAHLGPVAERLFIYLGPEMPFMSKMAMANRWLFDPLLKKKLLASSSTAALLRTTTAPTIFNAGVKDNILPAKARAVVNFRILPGDSIETVMDHALSVVDDSTIQIETYGIHSNPRPLSPVDAEAFRHLQRTVMQVYPEAIVVPGLVVGATDARHYTGLTEHIYNFSPLVVSREDLHRYHGHNERIGVENFHKLIFYYYLLLKQTAG